MDQLYLVSRGKSSIELEELDLSEISLSRLEEYAAKFPPYLRELLERVKRLAGTMPVTLETRERFGYERDDRPVRV